MNGDEFATSESCNLGPHPRRLAGVLGRLGTSREVRLAVLLVAVAGFLVTIPLYTGFDAAQPGMQFVEKTPWITRFNVQYLLGVDGISMPFILLNSLITVSSWCWPAGKSSRSAGRSTWAPS
jgi:NADH:ubiquinone oxidoreductase subunit 4 (subunit M)